ncbi:MAG TPA: hypothetical protein VLG92_05100 [Candidatus Saccharimonadia bacterium]|nr:hypothetical protein [Candidatus Saccharimonadia bacterium]
MLLLVHIIIALLGVVQATYALFMPSQTKIHISYGLVAATLVSGTVLVWQMHLSLVQPCLSGLVYVGALTGLLLGANYRLRLLDRMGHWSQYLRD